MNICKSLIILIFSFLLVGICYSGKKELTYYRGKIPSFVFDFNDQLIERQNQNSCKRYDFFYAIGQIVLVNASNLYENPKQQDFINWVKTQVQHLYDINSISITSITHENVTENLGIIKWVDYKKITYNKVKWIKVGIDYKEKSIISVINTVINSNINTNTNRNFNANINVIKE